MDDKIPSWLPDLILFENYKGKWDAYVAAVYQHFHKDFVTSKPSFQNVPVFVRYRPPYQEKGATFWHLVSEGPEESERTPDLRRCERICWPKAMIERAKAADVKIWETTRPWKGQAQRRINFALNNFSYIVVIAETSRGFDLVTAYCVTKQSRRDTLRQEYTKYSGQKKGGSAV
jgi:hypothetical protein